MKKIFLRVFICFIIMILMISIVVFFEINKNLFCVFKEGRSLNYQNEIESIVIYGSEDMEFIKGESKIYINDKKDIEKIISYFNSLEVVEVERIRGDDVEHGYFTLDISLKKDVPADEGFSFLNNHYLIYFDGEHKSQTKRYYIKDAKCDKNGKNKIYYFLYDLINSNKEKYIID